MDPLANAVWHALTTAHAPIAEVVGAARRYPVEVCPFAAVEDPAATAWDDLAALAGAGAPVALFREAPVVPPAGWEVVRSGVGHQLVLERLGDAPAVKARLLGPEDAPEMVSLVALTQPGPFRERTIELGRYWGVRDDDGALVAMAGERMHLSGWTEISAVCTHPSARRRGLGAALTALVAAAIVERDERPFLHVVEGNPARSVYDRLGFTHRRDVNFATAIVPT